jgi:hypothetical protein
MGLRALPCGSPQMEAPESEWGIRACVMHRSLMPGLCNDEGSSPRASRVSRVSPGSLARLALAATPPLVLIVLLTRPMVFEGSFSADGLNDLWFMWHQSLSIRSSHMPSLFLDHSETVFYPLFAFYGGTIFALGGVLSLALGNAPLQAYTLTYVIAFAASYGGLYWLARTMGLGRLLANVPSLVFITSAYYLTLIYARGDWPEFVGVSAIPLMVAAGISVVRSTRPGVWAMVALAGSSIVFFGSHDLTVLWGFTILAVTGVVVMVSVPAARRSTARRGLISACGVVLLALLVNAWYLLPTIAYASHTEIGGRNDEQTLRETMGLVSSAHLFTLSRASASKPGALFALSLPILVMLWLLASIVILLWTGTRGTWMRVLLILAGMTTAVIVTMTHAGLVLALPGPYTHLQFGYRLESYVLLGLSGAVLAVLVLIRHGAHVPSLWVWALAPILAVSMIGAVQQVDAYPGGEDAGLVLGSYTAPPRFLEGQDDYHDAYLPFLRLGKLPLLYVPPEAIHADRFSTTVHFQPGQLLETNIAANPDLLQVSGATVIGNDERAHAVLRVGSGTAANAAGASTTPTTTETISLSPADHLPIVLGRLLSLVGGVTLILGLVALSIGRAWRERRERGGRAGSLAPRPAQRDLERLGVDRDPL